MSEAANAADQQTDYDTEFAKHLAEAMGTELPAADTSAADTQSEAEGNVNDSENGSAEQSPAIESEAEAPEQETAEQLRKRLAEVEAELQKRDHQVRSEQGRQAALQRKVQELQAKAPQAPALTVDQLNAKLENLRMLDPDAADLIASLAANQAASTQYTQAAITPLYEQQIEQEQIWVQQRQQQAIAALAAEHPDWQETAKSPAFIAWKATLPPDLQAVVNNSNDPATASSFLTQFKSARSAAVGAQQASKQARFQGAVGVPRATPAVTDTGNDYDALLKKELKKMGIQTS